MYRINITNQVRKDGWRYFHEICNGDIFRYFDVTNEETFMKFEMEKAIQISDVGNLHGKIIKIAQHTKVCVAYSAQLTLTWDR